MTLQDGSLKTYALAVAVILIWGIIGYRIYIKMTSSEQPDELPITAVRQRQIANEKLDMSFDYRDPFLSAAPTSVSVERRSKVGVPSSKNAVPLVGWEQLTYFGALYNTTKKSRTAAVRVNGSEYFMSEGEEIGGFRLLKIFPDSIEVVNSNISRYLRKAKLKP